MKKLVGHQAIKIPPTIFICESVARKTQRSRIQVFDAAAAAQMQDERVVVIRNLSEQSYFGFHDLLHVPAHAVGIVIAFAVDDDAMRHPTHLKIDLLEVAAFKRRVVKDIEVLCAKCAWL